MKKTQIIQRKFTHVMREREANLSKSCLNSFLLLSYAQLRYKHNFGLSYPKIKKRTLIFSLTRLSCMDSFFAKKIDNRD